jgi:hypothetical protein
MNVPTDTITQSTVTMTANISLLISEARGWVGTVPSILKKEEGKSSPNAVVAREKTPELEVLRRHGGDTKRESKPPPSHVEWEPVLRYCCNCEEHPNESKSPQDQCNEDTRRIEYLPCKWRNELNL